MKHRRPHLVFLSVLAIWIVSLCYLQQIRQELRAARPVAELSVLLPKFEFIKIASLGYDSVVADWLWLRSIALFGARKADPATYPVLYQMIDLTTDIEPRLRIAYLFGATLLTFYSEHIDWSNALLEKAIVAFPQDWWFYFNLGFNHFYFLGDPKTAADDISRAATLPGHPPYLERLAASLYASAGHLESALQFLQQIYEASESEELRERILQKMRDLQEGEIPERLQEILEGEGERQ